MTRLFLTILILGAMFLAQAAQAGDINEYRAGDIRILRLSDKPGGIPDNVFLGDKKLLASELGGALCPSEFVVFLVTGPKGTALVDSGYGLDAGGRSLELLEKAGFPPEKLEAIYLTHMHPDHVGGLVAKGKKAFPAAKVYVDRKEFDYWKTHKDNSAFTAPARKFMEIYRDAIVPFDSDADLPEWLKTEPTPGHTPGHVVYSVANGGKRYLIGGDVIHCLKLQARHPDFALIWDVDPEMARQTRKDFLNRAANNGDIVLGGHFPAPGAAVFKKLREHMYDYTTIEPEKSR